MHPRASRIATGWVLVGTLLVASAPASADTETDYRSLITQGVEEFNLGNWAESHVAFKQAYELRPGPRPLKGMGMALFEQKRYAAAARALEQALAIVDTPSPLSTGQRDAASALLERSRRNTAQVSVAVTPAGARLFIDGQPVEGKTLTLDAGSYELSARAAGHRGGSVTLRVQAGDTPTVELELEPTTDGSTQPAPTAVSAGEGGSNVAGWIVLGAGTAATVGGLALAAVSHGDFSDLMGRCNEGRCDQVDPGDIDTAESQQTLGNALTFGGLAVSAVGVVMLLMMSDTEAFHAGPTAGCGPDGCGVQWRGTL